MMKIYLRKDKISEDTFQTRKKKENIKPNKKVIDKNIYWLDTKCLWMMPTWIQCCMSTENVSRIIYYTCTNVINGSVSKYEKQIPTKRFGSFSLSECVFVFVCVLSVWNATKNQRDLYFIEIDETSNGSFASFVCQSCYWHMGFQFQIGFTFSHLCAIQSPVIDRTSSHLKIV